MNHQKQFQIELAVSLIKSAFDKAYIKDGLDGLVSSAFWIAEETADQIADMIGPCDCDCDACDEAAAQAEAEAAMKEIEEMIATLKARLG